EVEIGIEPRVLFRELCELRDVDVADEMALVSAERAARNLESEQQAIAFFRRQPFMKAAAVLGDDGASPAGKFAVRFAPVNLQDPFILLSGIPFPQHLLGNGAAPMAALDEAVWSALGGHVRQIDEI